MTPPPTDAEVIAGTIMGIAGIAQTPDEALIDTWERMKVPPALPLPENRPDMIWVFRSPPEYDKPFDGLLVIQEFRGESLLGSRGCLCELCCGQS